MFKAVTFVSAVECIILLNVKVNAVRISDEECQRLVGGLSWSTRIVKLSLKRHFSLLK